MATRKKKATLAEFASWTDEYSQADARKFFALFTLYLEAMKVDECIGVPQLGIFTKKKTKPRKGRNPITGETIKVPAKVKIAFRVASNLRNM